MKALIKSISLIVVLVSILLSAAFLHTHKTKRDQLLRVQKTDSELGAVHEGEQLTHQVTLSNTSGSNLEDIRLSASCGCTSVNPDQLSLAAGESETVELVIDTKGFLQRSPSFSETFQVVLKASFLDDSKETLQETFPIGGTVQRWAIPSPASIEFDGMNPIVQGDVGRREVTLQLDDGIELGSVTLDPAGGEVDIRREAQLTKLVYLHHASEQTGPFEGTILLSATKNGAELPPLRIPVSGTVIPPYELIPRQVAIPPQPVGQVLTRTVKLRSLKNIPFEVEMIPGEDAQIHVETLNSAEDSTWRELKLTVTMSESGDYLYEPVLKILPLEGDNLPVEFSVPVRSYGLPQHVAQQTLEKSSP